MVEQMQAKPEPAQMAQKPEQPNIGQMQPIEEKKSRWWIWLLIVLGVVIVGALVYLLFF